MKSIALLVCVLSLLCCCISQARNVPLQAKHDLIQFTLISAQFPYPAKTSVQVTGIKSPKVLQVSVAVEITFHKIPNNFKI